MKSVRREERLYEVFARRDSSEALHRVGRVTAPTGELACARAWFVFDEHKWIEMQVVPLQAMMAVRGDVHDTLAEGRA
jgi:hypothetical protein